MKPDTRAVPLPPSRPPETYGGLPRVPLGKLFDEESSDIQPPLLSDATAARIAELIEDGVYPAGGRLPSERQLAESLQVSRLVVREAFQKLDAMGLVNAHVGRGRFVADSGRDGRSSFFVSRWLQLHQEELKELSEVRAVLESAAAEAIPVADLPQVAAQSRIVQVRAQAALANGDIELLVALDREFHRVPVGYTVNRPLRVLAAGIIDSMRPSVHAVMTVSEAAQLSLRQHEAIVCAFESGDRLLASVAIAHHLRTANRRALEASLMDVGET